MASFFSIILALLILGVIIMVHEFGHFIVGKKSGIGVTEFSVGMGPKILGWKKNGTQYSLRAIPLGGFCSFVGEDENSEDPRAMNNQPVFKRLLTVFAGPFLNFVLAFVAAVILIAGGMIINPYESVVSARLGYIDETMPAYEAGLMVNDLVTHLNGEAISDDAVGVKRMQDMISSAKPGDSILFTVLRDEQSLDIAVAPVYDQENQKMMVGVAYYSMSQPYDCNVITAVPEALVLMGRTVVDTVAFLKDMIGGIFAGNGVQDGAVSGVVGIVSTMSSELKEGFAARFSDVLYMVVYWFFIISLNLGIMNLLPLPALDGGRLVFLIYEAIFRKPIPRDKEAIVHFIGFVLLIILMIIITVSDITKLVK